MFNNHICSYERKYCCSIKPLNSANKCFAPILTWKKFGPLGWVIYKVIEERRATITISDRQMQDYLKRLDLYLFFWINCYWNLGLSWNWTEAKDFLRNQEILSDNSVISGRNSVCRWSKVGTVRGNDGSWAFWIRAGNQKEKQNSCQGIFNSIFRFLSIREFGIWKLYRTAAFWLSDFKSLNNIIVLVLFSPLVWRYNTGFVYKRISDFVLALNHRFRCCGMLWF